MFLDIIQRQFIGGERKKFPTVRESVKDVTKSDRPVTITLTGKTNVLNVREIFKSDCRYCQTDGISLSWVHSF